jgi:hypothetical protein
MQFRDVLTIAANARPGRALPGGWTPASITSATPRGFIDFEDNSKITVATGVSQITDTISGSNFVQATGTAQPLLITSATTGRQVASFDGTDDNLAIASIPTNWPTGSTAGGFAVVANYPSSATTLTAFAYGGSSASSHRGLQRLADSGFRAFAGDGGSKTADNTTVVPSSGRHTVIVPISATQFSCDVDGAVGALTASVPATGTSRARIGCGASTSAASFFAGEISAVVVWTGTLSALETQYLYLWAGTRLGLRS